VSDDRRLIEDFLPIQAISKEASREKSVRKGHISTLHLWWARRPLVACRAAVYGALVPASRFVPDNGPDNKKQSLGRANAAKFVEALCKYPGNPNYIRQAQEHILDAHAVRLTDELMDGRKKGKAPAWVEEFKWSQDKETVRREDIEQGRAPRPKVLDMFAGGGAIPLEALRMGCEAYALDLNPVAHIIELCTLVYPQKYGKPDPNVRGMTGPENVKGETTWGGLAEEVRYWGEWVLKKVKAEIGDLYPLIPDPEYKGNRPAVQSEMWQSSDKESIPPGYLMPVAYLWTRTVRCKNPSCGATVPLVRQTWLCKKKNRYVALKMVAPKGKKKVCFEVVEAATERDLGFDPAEGSKGGNATCPFCGTVADLDYVKAEANRNCLEEQIIAVVCAPRGIPGKVYLSMSDVPETRSSISEALQGRLEAITQQMGTDALTEKIEANPRSFDTQHFGLTQWSDIFSTRQLITLLSFAKIVRELARGGANGYEQDLWCALIVFLATMVSRMANFSSKLCLWNYTGGRGVVHSFSRQSLPMTWDYPESNPFYPDAAGWQSSIESVVAVLDQLPQDLPAQVLRGKSQSLPFGSGTLDAVITDPPYYDNVSYSNLSDFFFVWLKRMLSDVLPEHFSLDLTPKRSEIISAF
jgi:putative DNA methylase